MTSKMIKVPGPDHPITIAQNPNRVVVKIGDVVIADTREALALREGSYGAVQYIPRKDVDMSLLARTDHTSHCPYKGDASYFTVTSGGTQTINAVWSYEAPYEAVGSIRDYLAFYPNRVEIIEHPAAASSSAT